MNNDFLQSRINILKSSIKINEKEYNKNPNEILKKKIEKDKKELFEYNLKYPGLFI